MESYPRGMADVPILVIQPATNAPVGKLGEWLTEAGMRLDVLDPATDEVPVEVGEHAGLIVLDGPASATADIDHPWLASLRKLLSHAVTNGVPTLAIGLGAHLLAMATGGRIAPRADGPEAGTLLIAKRDSAAEDVLLGPLPLTPDVFQFRTEEIVTLPPTAQLLAASPKGENQAFRVGDRAYGLQFHIETTPAMVVDWAQRNPGIAEAIRGGQLEPEHLDQFHEDLAETWRPMVERFAEMAATPPEERVTTRSLPLL